MTLSMHIVQRISTDRASFDSCRQDTSILHKIVYLHMLVTYSPVGPVRAPGL